MKELPTKRSSHYSRLSTNRVSKKKSYRPSFNGWRMRKRVKLSNKEVPNKKDITDLEERLAILDGKIKSHEGSSVNDEDLKTLEQKLAEFELKIKDKTVNERDMAILKLRMHQFESKLQDRQGDSVGKENQKKTEGLLGFIVGNLHSSSQQNYWPENK